MILYKIIRLILFKTKSILYISKPIVISTSYPLSFRDEWTYSRFGQGTLGSVKTMRVNTRSQFDRATNTRWFPAILAYDMT
jgi:hypothetical protein